MKTNESGKVEIPIASLIDIVFLLIVFFLVTSEFDKEIDDDSIQLAESYFIDPVTKKDPRTITINLKRINDSHSVITIATVPVGIDQLRSILRNTVTRFGTTVPVVIRADGDLQFREVDHLIEILKQTGLYRIRLSSRRVAAVDYRGSFPAWSFNDSPQPRRS